MPIDQVMYFTREPRTRASHKTRKLVWIAIAYIAGVALIGAAQLTLDQMAGDATGVEATAPIGDAAQGAIVAQADRRASARFQRRAMVIDPDFAEF